MRRNGLLIYKNTSDTAVVVLHEIYGINAHIQMVCDEYNHLGYDVYCPDLIGRGSPFEYLQQDTAYDYFKHNIGFDVYLNVLKLLKELRPQYRTILLIGYSVGATIAWRCSPSGLCDGVIGYYGSRIRDYLDVTPSCKVLLIFAENEPSFYPDQLRFTQAQQENISVVILAGHHGFCDIFSEHYNPDSCSEAQLLAIMFIAEIKKQLGPCHDQPLSL